MTQHRKDYQRPGLAMSMLRAAAPAGLALAALAEPALTATGRAAPRSEEPTPIIEPVAQPKPVFLPVAQRAFTATAPEPLDNELRGYVTGLSAAGRDACQPGRYAILDKPEGRLDAKALAVLYSARTDLNLDLFVGSAVRLSGPMAQAPAGCRLYTPWLVQVEKIEVIDLPPGG